jgi:2,3-bisphosphoglycerate-independent phosphoglycerate mutase
MPQGVELIIQPVKEHRAAMLFRGEGLSGEVEDTDPQMTGVPPLDPVPRTPEAKGTAELARDFLSQAREILAEESPANMLLLRGFDSYTPIPSMEERFRLKCLALASYPMYKGLAGLVGMKVLQGLDSLDAQMEAIRARYDDYDFFFFHAKEADAKGEDGDFQGKVKALEKIDAFAAEVASLAPDVLVITGDHSTPALMKKHSFHPVPVLLRSRYARVDDVKSFDEKSCARGGMGRMNTAYLMGLAMAHADRLSKYGA